MTYHTISSPFPHSLILLFPPSLRPSFTSFAPHPNDVSIVFDKGAAAATNIFLKVTTPGLVLVPTSSSTSSNPLLDTLGPSATVISLSLDPAAPQVTHPLTHPMTHYNTPCDTPINATTTMLTYDTLFDTRSYLFTLSVLPPPTHTPMSSRLHPLSR